MTSGGQPGTPVAIAARALVLLAAAGACVLAALLVRGEDVAPPLAYACPMHPEARAAAPGACPICGMSLALAAAPPAIAADDLTTVTSLVIARDLVGPAWTDGPGMLRALFYRDEVPLLVPGEMARFEPASGGAGKARYAGVIGPGVDPATVAVSFVLTSGAAGQGVGRLELASRNGKALVVPYRSVIRSPPGPYVLAVAPDGRTLVPRPVILGRVFVGFATVVAGVGEGDRLVGDLASLYDADWRGR